VAAFDFLKQLKEGASANLREQRSCLMKLGQPPLFVNDIVKQTALCALDEGRPKRADLEEEAGAALRHHSSKRLLSQSKAEAARSKTPILSAFPR